MKRLWMLAVTAFLAGACAGAESPGQPAQEDKPAERAAENVDQHKEASKLLMAYAQVQQALAADQLEEAKQAASRLAEISEGKIADLSAQASQSSDLEALRQSFIPLSEEVIAQEGAQGGFRVALCPMANDSQGASWLQKDGPIRNPYYGSEMLECGYFPESDE